MNSDPMEWALGFIFIPTPLCGPTQPQPHGIGIEVPTVVVPLNSDPTEWALGSTSILTPLCGPTDPMEYPLGSPLEWSH